MKTLKGEILYSFHFFFFASVVVSALVLETTMNYSCQEGSQVLKLENANRTINCEQSWTADSVVSVTVSFIMSSFLTKQQIIFNQMVKAMLYVMLYFSQPIGSFMSGSVECHSPCINVADGEIIIRGCVNVTLTVICNQVIAIGHSNFFCYH